jgi:predicted nucleic acid-binding protein
MSGDRVFVDTNIFVYAKMEDDDEKEKHVKAVHFLENIKEEIVVSVQVVNEFANVLIRHKIEHDSIRRAVREMAAACEVSALTMHTVNRAWQIITDHRISYRDSLIVASAMENHCTALYSEDLQHDRIITFSESRIHIVNPFQQ